MAVKYHKLGPGVLTLGDAGVMDASCQLQNGEVAWDKDEEDPVTVLCGDVIPGAVTYTATFSGTMVQDLADDGIVEWTWDNKGTEQDFVYVPNDTAAKQVSGTLIVDPLTVGSTEDFGATMTSDFEWTIVGEPTLGAYTPVGAQASSPEQESSPEPVNA